MRPAPGALIFCNVSACPDTHHMLLTWLNQHQPPDEGSPTSKLSDLDRIFLATNFEEDRGASEASQMNLDNALMRFEFLEALVRVAAAKVGVPINCVCCTVPAAANQVSQVYTCDAAVVLAAA